MSKQIYEDSEYTAEEAAQEATEGPHSHDSEQQDEQEVESRQIDSDDYEKDEDESDYDDDEPAKKRYRQ